MDWKCEVANQRLDDIAWKTIHESATIPMPEYGYRPRNYAELEQRLQSGVDFEDAWSDFRHAFFAHKDASFFSHPSPPSLSIEWQAVLAGAAEWLSAEFGLPHPVWTDECRYFLPEPWDVWEEIIGTNEFLDEHMAKSPEAFRKRNVAFLSRNLIAL